MFLSSDYVWVGWSRSERGPKKRRHFDKICRVIFPLANYARYAAEQDKKYITKMKISWILRIKHCHGKPHKNRGIDQSKMRMIIYQNIYHALFRHERAKGSIQCPVQWERKCLCCQKCPLKKPFPDPEQLSDTFDEERAKQGVMRVSVFVNPLDFRLLWLHSIAPAVLKTHKYAHTEGKKNRWERDSTHKA